MAFPHFPSLFRRKIPIPAKILGKQGCPELLGLAGCEFLTLFPFGKSNLSQSCSNPVYPSPVQVQFIPVQLKSNLSQSCSNPIYPSSAQIQFIPFLLKFSLSQSSSNPVYPSPAPAPSQVRFKLDFQDLGFFSINLTL